MDKASLVRTVLAVLGALKLVLASFGINIPQELIDDVADFAGLGFVIYGIVRHNFFGKKGAKQKAALKREGLAK